MIIAIILGSFVLVLFLIIFGFLIWLYRKFFYSPLKGQNNEYRVDRVDYKFDKEKLHALVTKMLAIPYQDLYTTSYDGLKLHAYLYENKQSNHYILMFNGYRGIPRRDYCGKALDLMKTGKNIILCDQRAHGQSEGHTISLGRKEQHDVVTWVNFIREKYGKSAKITVVGISMGASTVLLASDKLPPEVTIFADSAYSSEKVLISNLILQKKLSPKIIWPLVYLSELIFGHAKLKDDVAEHVAKSKCKMLIIHGGDDSLVPVESNKKLFEANKEHVQVVIFEGLNHALAFLERTEEYREILYKFLNQQNQNNRKNF